MRVKFDLFGTVICRIFFKSLITLATCRLHESEASVELFRFQCLTFLPRAKRITSAQLVILPINTTRMLMSLSWSSSFKIQMRKK